MRFFAGISPQPKEFRWSSWTRGGTHSWRTRRRSGRCAGATCELPRHAVTQFRQPKGAKRWVWHPEYAQCGHMGGDASKWIVESALRVVGPS